MNIRRLLPRLATITGLVALSIGVFLNWPSSPGRLVVEQSLIVWQGKTPSEGGTVDDGAAAIFKCRNAGGRPVRILSTESGCGCATPSVEPTTLGPGEGGIVRVHAVPFPLGERDVAITLNTDSAITPTIKLTLHMIGSQTPPFLVTMVGDLTFVEGETTRGETREIKIVAVEPLASHPMPTTPEPRSDLAFLHFDKPTVETKPYVVSDSIQNDYTYRVSIVSEPPPGTFGGEVRVIDPWIPGRTLSLRVSGRSHQSLKAVPATLTLSPDSHDPKVIRVLTDGKSGDIRVESALKEKSSLIIERIDSTDSGRIAAFSVRAKPGRSLDKNGEVLTVYSLESPANSIRVPVLVAAGVKP